MAKTKKAASAGTEAKFIEFEQVVRSLFGHESKGQVLSVCSLIPCKDGTERPGITLRYKGESKIVWLSEAAIEQAAGDYAGWYKQARPVLRVQEWLTRDGSYSYTACAPSNMAYELI